MRGAWQFCWGDLLVILILILICSSPIVGLLFGRLLMNTISGGAADQAHPHRDDGHQHHFPLFGANKPLSDRQTASRDQSSFSWAQCTLEKVRCARLRLGLRLRLRLSRVSTNRTAMRPLGDPIDRVPREMLRCLHHAQTLNDSIRHKEVPNGSRYV